MENRNKTTLLSVKMGEIVKEATSVDKTRRLMAMYNTSDSQIMKAITENKEVKPDNSAPRKSKSGKPTDSTIL